MSSKMSSVLARRVAMADAHKGGERTRWCALIYATQNGWKLPILFEELGVPYDWVLVDFEKNEQKSAEFLQINPNGRIPALIDRQRNITVAESGAILEYVCEELDSCLLPSRKTDLQQHLHCRQWVYWQVSGLGPMMGQSMYFNRLAKVQGQTDEFSIGRFGKESRRLLEILDEQIKNSGGPFILGKHVSLADVACFAYVASAFWACVEISDLKDLSKWLKTLHARPSFARGVTIPFARPAFFGQPYATKEEIDAEIARNSSHFVVVEKKQ